MKHAKQNPKRIRRVLIIAVLVVMSCLLFKQFHHDKSPEQKPVEKPSLVTKTPQKTPSKPTKKIRFIATGDMLPHDTVNQAAKSGASYDYLPLFSEVRSFMQDSDMSFCNQESPSASQFKVSGYPTFNAPNSFAQDLSRLGCNVINLANNHANDRGQAGVSATRAVWDRLPTLAVAGTGRTQAEHDSVPMFTKNGVKFAFLSYAKCSNSTLPNSYGVDILSKSLADKQIAQARANGADMIIVATHWCREGVSTQNADQDAWGRYFASKGVDIVVGTGPHWLQPAKRLDRAGGGKTLVWFSLGNFLSTQLEVNGLIGGIAVMEIDPVQHVVTEAGFLPTYMHYEWTAAQAAKEDLLARHNLKLYPLDLAAAALARSQTHTTVAAQTARVTKLLNTYTPITMLTSKTYQAFGE